MGVSISHLIEIHVGRDVPFFQKLLINKFITILDEISLKNTKFDSISIILALNFQNSSAENLIPKSEIGHSQP